MNILIVSDTHGEISATEQIIRREKPDHVIHLGDCIRDAENLDRSFPYLPICKVPGNNDWFTDSPKEKTVTLGGTAVFLCHGHTTGVKYGLQAQITRTLQYGAAVSLFGHTHSPYLGEENGILLINPGSVTYTGTYAILTLTPGEKPRAEIRYDR